MADIGMVEKVAIAICNATGEFFWEEEDERIRSEFRKEARAAIAKMREPTGFMVHDARARFHDEYGEEATLREIYVSYQAAIDAALNEESDNG